MFNFANQVNFLAAVFWLLNSGPEGINKQICLELLFVETSSIRKLDVNIQFCE